MSVIHADVGYTETSPREIRVGRFGVGGVVLEVVKPSRPGGLVVIRLHLTEVEALRLGGLLSDPRAL